jgi:hypothetical protein
MLAIAKAAAHCEIHNSSEWSVNSADKKYHA